MSLHRITPTTRLLARTFRASPLAASRASPVVAPFARPSHALGSTRFAATTARPETIKMSPGENLNLLNQQRSVRPSSPHFTIYEPQLTWLLSILNRVTGVGLSVVFYVYAMTYAGAPLMGLQSFVQSGHLTELVATAPFWLKLAVKAPLAFAFNFHNFNGIRHLVWDRGYCE